MDMNGLQRIIAWAGFALLLAPAPATAQSLAPLRELVRSGARAERILEAARLDARVAAAITALPGSRGQAARLLGTTDTELVDTLLGLRSDLEASDAIAGADSTALPDSSVTEAVDRAAIGAATGECTDAFCAAAVRDLLDDLAGVGPEQRSVHGLGGAFDIQGYPALDPILTSTSYDLVVVGGSVSGLTAARRAQARLTRVLGRRARVLVLEGRKMPADGARLAEPEVNATALARRQILAIRARIARQLEELEMEIPDRYSIHEYPPGAEPTEADSSVKGDPHEITVSANSHVVPINELQALLLETVGHTEGIDVVFDAAVGDIQRVTRDEVRLSVHDSNGKATTLRTRHVLGADGSNSSLREAAGIEVDDGQPVQGTMMAVWFDAPAHPGRYVHQVRTAGRTGVLLQHREQLYGLFALPPELGQQVEDAAATGRELSATERQRITDHVESIARELVNEAEASHIHVREMTSFPVQSRTAHRASSPDLRLLLVGDAIAPGMTPYAGMGANAAVLEGVEAADTLAEIERSLASGEDAAPLYQSFDEEMASWTNELSRMTGMLRITFGARTPAKAP